MTQESSKDKKELPEWTKPKMNLVGIDLNQLNELQLHKLISFMEEIKYEPIQFSRDNVTKD